MAAANFSKDVLEMFYGPIDENQRLRPPGINNYGKKSHIQIHIV